MDLCFSVFPENHRVEYFFIDETMYKNLSLKITLMFCLLQAGISMSEFRNLHGWKKKAAVDFFLIFLYSTLARSNVIFFFSFFTVYKNSYKASIDNFSRVRLDDNQFLPSKLLRLIAL